MKDYDVRVFKVPCDARGRPVGKPRQPRTVRRAAADDEAVRRMIKRELEQAGGKVVSINTSAVPTDRRPGSMVAYVEDRTLRR